MTRGEAIKDFFCKTILPVAAAALLYCIFRSACVKTGELDYLWLWILCGLPFGIWRLRLWIIPGGGSLGSGIALFALNFILAGIIGGFVLVWRLIVAVWYVPLTVCKRTIITRPEQSYGRVPLTELCRLFISVYVPGAGLPGARASAFPSPHGSEICPDRAAYSAPAIDTHKAQCRWPWPFPPANTQWHWIPRP